MSYQSRVKTWIAGEVLYASDLNAEFDAILATLIPEPDSEAQGDILYRGASAWSRLAAGTAHQKLKMNSGATAPEWASENEVYIEWWNANAGDGSTDCGAAFQSAIDYLGDSTNGRISLINGKNYKITTNVIFGNTHIEGNNATITADLSDGFTITSSSSDYNGVFTTKTEDGNYANPASITKLKFSNIHFVAAKTSTGGTARSYLFRLVDIDGATFENCRFTTTCTGGTYFVNAFIDCHHEISNLNIDKCYFNQSAGTSEGGCVWIRGYDEGDSLIEKVIIDSCDFVTNAGDELLSIYSRGSATVKNIKALNCSFYNSYSGSAGVIIVYNDSSSGTVKDIILQNIYAEATAVNTRIIRGNANSGTFEGIKLLGSEIHATINGTGTPSLVEGFDIVNNADIFIETYTASGANVFVFNSCGIVSKSEVHITSSVESDIDSGGYKLVSAYNCDEILHSKLAGKLTDNDRIDGCTITTQTAFGTNLIENARILTNNYITTPDDSSYRMFHQSSLYSPKVSYVLNNIFVDNSSSDSATVFWLGNVDNEYIINNNTYRGAKTKWGSLENAIQGNVQGFNNNVMLESDGTFRSHSDRCPSTTNPWTLYGTGAETMPVGHVVWKSDPAVEENAGWIKIAEVGDATADWAELPVLGKNVGEAVTAESPNLQTYGYSNLDASSNNVSATLPDGAYDGEIKTIRATNVDNAVTVSATHHETSDPEVFTFDTVGDTLILQWSGATWLTIKNFGCTV